MKNKGLATLIIACATALQAQAQPGFYAGASIGSTDFELDDGQLASDDIGYKVFGGYDFNRYFGVELAYFDGGALVEDLFDLELGVSGFISSAIGRVPLGDSFALFARLGYSAYDIDVDSSFLGLQSQDDSGSDLDEGAEFSMTSVSGLYRF